MSTITELIVDAYDCGCDLNDVEALKRHAIRAAESVGAKVAEVAFHRFQPHGVTVSLILMESHLVLSTWPEHRLAIVNIFLCNPSMSTDLCWQTLAEFLKPASTTVHHVPHKLTQKAKPAKAA
jgi:S-adenosylmethionine decarboxylase